MTHELAFPADSKSQTDSGMLLLDYFAAKAMQSICNTGDWNDIIGHEGKISEMSYNMAAAMLEERKKYSN